eukprot:TRINITY_DN30732_c0_g2_i1.p1 TRINITY_DN30732_c0_g2~~TRINITY_DN30732_c0_g2_i1.p1  ORF type:complete len:157 (+),score=27.49 TRINITY_DN30732_c0_g2_i1:96-566(+)
MSALLICVFLSCWACALCQTCPEGRYYDTSSGNCLRDSPIYAPWVWVSGSSGAQYSGPSYNTLGSMSGIASTTTTTGSVYLFGGQVADISFYTGIYAAYANLSVYGMSESINFMDYTYGFPASTNQTDYFPSARAFAGLFSINNEALYVFGGNSSR